MRVINFTPLMNRADFFGRPEDAIIHGLGNPRARRVRDELPGIRGARVVDGRCDFTSVTFILSNGMDLCYYVHDEIADWRIEPSAQLRQPQPIIEPVLLRSQYGEGVFDALQTLRGCVDREIVSMSANLSSAQLGLSNMPLAFCPALVKETGQLFLNWFDMREPDEIAAETQNTAPRTGPI